VNDEEERGRDEKTERREEADITRLNKVLFTLLFVRSSDWQHFVNKHFDRDISFLAED